MEVIKIEVDWYFSKAENKALSKYAAKHQVSKSEAIKVLVKEALSQVDEAPKKTFTIKWLVEQIEGLESKTESTSVVMQHLAEKVEKLQEEISYLEDEIDCLENKIKFEARKAE